MGLRKQIIGSDRKSTLILVIKLQPLLLYSASSFPRFLLLLWVYVLSEVPLSVICAAVRLRLSIRVAFKSNLPEMFTLATFSCFQHSENIYAPTLRSLIPMHIDRLYSGVEL